MIDEAEIRKNLEAILAKFPKNKNLLNFQDDFEDVVFNQTRLELTGRELRKIKLGERIAALAELKSGCHKYAHEHIEDSIAKLKQELSNV